MEVEARGLRVYCSDSQGSKDKCPLTWDYRQLFILNNQAAMSHVAEQKKKHMLHVRCRMCDLLSPLAVTDSTMGSTDPMLVVAPIAGGLVAP